MTVDLLPDPTLRPSGFPTVPQPHPPRLCYSKFQGSYPQPHSGRQGLTVRKHLTGGFLCTVLDLSGILCSLLIPEYSGMKRRGKPLPGLRNPGTSFLVLLYGDKYPLPFYEPYGKSGYLQLFLSYG